METNILDLPWNTSLNTIYRAVESLNNKYKPEEIALHALDIMRNHPDLSIQDCIEETIDRLTHP